MSGAAIKINDQEVKAMIKRILRNLGDMTPAMKIIGSIVRASVIRNFEKGGRPVKWKSHSKVTEKRRKGGAILRKQGMAGGLMGSISYTADKNSVRIGTNKVYAAVHQFGAKKGSFGTFMVNIGAHTRKGSPVRAQTRNVKLPWGDIPARPFLMIQNEDVVEIKDALSGFILGN